MTGTAGLYLAACGLLAVAGALKAAGPATTALALTRLWPRLTLRPARGAVRTLAGAEAALGLVGIAYPSPIAAALVAASFAAFTGVVLFARARGGPLATCGCFGQPDTPPTAAHAALDAVLAAAAAVFAGSGTARLLPAFLSHQYVHGAPLLAGAALCGWLAYLVMVPLSRLQAAAAAVRPR